MYIYKVVIDVGTTYIKKKTKIFCEYCVFFYRTSWLFFFGLRWRGGTVGRNKINQTETVLFFDK